MPNLDNPLHNDFLFTKRKGESHVIAATATTHQNRYDTKAEFTDGVVAASEVVGGILLTGDQLLRVEELAVGARADLIDHGRLQVDLRNSKEKHR